MKGIGRELTELSEDSIRFEDNFENGTDCFARSSILLHTLKYLMHVKDRINGLPDSKSLTSDCLR
jgi:hypothetical protein